MTRTYALKRLLEHGALTVQQMIEITGWKPKQVWGTIQQMQKTRTIRRLPKMTWGLIDDNPMPYQGNYGWTTEESQHQMLVTDTSLSQVRLGCFTAHMKAQSKKC